MRLWSDLLWSSRLRLRLRWFGSGNGPVGSAEGSASRGSGPEVDLGTGDLTGISPGNRSAF